MLKWKETWFAMCFSNTCCAPAGSANVGATINFLDVQFPHM